jgi:predicted nuclease of predicted toxin-antitoxin system
MRIKVDEDLPRVVTQMLRAKGHDSVSVTEQAMGGAKDDALWDVVQAEERFLVTADKGFGDIRLRAPGTHSGILLLRPARDGIQPIIALMERVLAEYELETLQGTVTVVTPQGIRVRRASMGD